MPETEPSPNSDVATAYGDESEQVGGKTPGNIKGFLISFVFHMLLSCVSMGRCHLAALPA